MHPGHAYPVVMRTLRRSDVALVTGAAVVVAVLVLLDDRGWLEWLFGTFMLSGLGWLTRLGVDAWLAARDERRRAERLESTRPSVVAAQAVVLERARLTEEVETCIEQSLRDIAAELDGLDPAVPVPALQRVHGLTRRTTAELRRMLGLLRNAEREEGIPTARPDVPPGRALVDSPWLQGLMVAVLAAVESSIYLVTQGPSDWLPWSPVTSALAAATLGLRRLSPPAAVLAFTCVVGVASVTGHPVTGGFWIVITLGVLVWSLAATPPTGRTDLLARAGAAALLVSVTSWAFSRDDPENLGALLLVVGVSGAGGLLVGTQRWGRRRAHRRAEERERALAASVGAAVRSERTQVARELHDVVSHAVGVIALQAGAAELSWPHDTEATDRAVRVIRRTAAEALQELDRLSRSGTPTSGGADDLLTLVDRVRTAGTPVDLTVVGEAGDHAAVVHRIVQESLTNAMRHAPGAAVRVRVTSDANRTTVTVRDTGPGPSGPTTPGYGLVGLAERVGFLHGTFRSGAARRGRGFEVEATLPVTEATGAR